MCKPSHFTFRKLDYFRTKLSSESNLNLAPFSNITVHLPFIILVIVSQFFDILPLMSRNKHWCELWFLNMWSFGVVWELIVNTNVKQIYRWMGIMMFNNIAVMLLLTMSIQYNHIIYFIYFRNDLFNFNFLLKKHVFSIYKYDFYCHY